MSLTVHPWLLSPFKPHSLWAPRLESISLPQVLHNNLLLKKLYQRKLDQKKTCPWPHPAPTWQKPGFYPRPAAHMLESSAKVLSKCWSPNLQAGTPVSGLETTGQHPQLWLRPFRGLRATPIRQVPGQELSWPVPALELACQSLRKLVQERKRIKAKPQREIRV